MNAAEQAGTALARSLEACRVDCEWLTSALCINFDVDVGHVLENSAGEALPASAVPICMPDTGAALGDNCFAFRLLRDGGRAPLWGFSLFRARRDASCKRGVFQKAVVILSPLPLFWLFRRVVASLAEEYFARGVDALHEALERTRAWPSPASASARELAQLQLGWASFELRLSPCELGPVLAIPGGHADHQALGDRGGQRRAEAVRELVEQPLRPLCALGRSCWTLWQLMLMGESIVVLAPTPALCTDVILALTSLLAPLSCMSIVRPYLSVHAPDWDVLSGAAPPPGSGLLLGATNPVLERAVPAWQSLLNISEPSDRSGSTGPGRPPPPSAAEAAASSGGGGGSGGGGWFGSLIDGLSRSDSPHAAARPDVEADGWQSGWGLAEPSEGGAAAQTVSWSWTSSVDIFVRWAAWT